MNSHDSRPAPRPGSPDRVGAAGANDAKGPDDSASPAELAFIERVRSDRERARTLRRRALLAGATSAVLIGALFLTYGIPRSSGDNVATAHPGRLTLGVPPHNETWEQRIARLEGRVGALEDQAAAVGYRSQGWASPPAAAPPGHTVESAKATPGPGVAAAAPSSVRAEPAPPRRAAARKAPRPVPAPPRDVRAASIESPKRVTVTAATAPAARHQTQEVTFGETVRRGWESVERHVRRAPGELREGFTRVRRLFAD